MKLLLTSGGVTNTSIRETLVDLLGKPIADSTALCIPTAEYGHPMCTPASAWRFIAGQTPAPMCDLGWKSVGVLELTALPSIGKDRWVPWVQEVDVLLVDGGDATYLCHWMRQSGLADLLPSLAEKVWVGVSAGSMVMTPRIGDYFVEWTPPTGSDRTLGGRRLLDLPAPGARAHAGKHHGRGREMGRRHRGSGVRHRRPDGHQGDRRHRRGRLRGTVEVPSLLDTDANRE
ncbi:Type 1 glutamine amidotransferase-like domain-containing protein [Nonomuraea sp. JJY05]|uniref:Type 1 glutamine amidotransferase-like domain-containing protein n=1 Tax=Nonomuraea sp. JJY05 TaxID=3350255 RepID=UPI00373EA15F